MSIQKHAFYNAHLNTLVSQKVSYKHTYTTDTFHTPSTNTASNTNTNTKVRVSKETKTGKIIQFCEKQRVLDVDVYQGEGIGFRLSINIELPINEKEFGRDNGRERVKDRMSYYNQCIRCDLTQVKAEGRVTHELELELEDCVGLRSACQAYRNGDLLNGKKYIDTIDILLGSARQLTRTGSHVK